jgi:hypothetical protein
VREMPAPDSTVSASTAKAHTSVAHKSQKVSILDEPSKGPLIRGIERLKDLPGDWNGPQSSALNPASFKAALDFAKSTEKWVAKNNKRIPKLHVGPTNSGGIVFQWFGRETNGRELILTFEPSSAQNCRYKSLRVDEANGIEDESDFTRLDQAVDCVKWLLG